MAADAPLARLMVLLGSPLRVANAGIRRSASSAALPGALGIQGLGFMAINSFYMSVAVMPQQSPAWQTRPWIVMQRVCSTKALYFINGSY